MWNRDFAEDDRIYYAIHDQKNVSMRNALVNVYDELIYVRNRSKRNMNAELHKKRIQFVH